MKSMVPSTSILREGPAPVARDRGIKHHKLFDVIGVFRGQYERDWPTPIMSNEKIFFYAQMLMNEFPNILSDGRFVIAT
jgi:hypothetical protein